MFKSNALVLVIGCQFIFSFREMIWSPILPSVVNQLAPDNLRGVITQQVQMIGR